MIMQSRKIPFMLEFTGSPEAGKTTAIHKLTKLLTDSNIKVGYVREAAELLPTDIPKPSWDATTYLHLITAANILLSTHSNNDIVIIDRGAIDRQFWTFHDFNKNLCSIQQFSEFLAFQSFFGMLPNLLVALVADPVVSLERRGGPGKVVNFDFLTKYNSLFMDFYPLIEVPKVLIDTSQISQEQVLEIIKKILDAHWKKSTEN